MEKYKTIEPKIKLVMATGCCMGWGRGKSKVNGKTAITLQLFYALIIVRIA
jgi:hypothetical protein